MNVFDLHFGEGVRGGLLRIGNSVTPVALLAVGLTAAGVGLLGALVGW